MPGSVPGRPITQKWHVESLVIVKVKKGCYFIKRTGQCPPRARRQTRYITHSIRECFCESATRRRSFIHFKLRRVYLGLLDTGDSCGWLTTLKWPWILMKRIRQSTVAPYGKPKGQIQTKEKIKGISKQRKVVTSHSCSVRDMRHWNGMVVTEPMTSLLHRATHSGSRIR